VSDQALVGAYHRKNHCAGNLNPTGSRVTHSRQNCMILKKTPPEWSLAEGMEITVTAERYRVASVEWRGHLKQIRLAKPARPLLLPRSACVSVGDDVVITPERITVPCRNGDTVLHPSYAARETVSVGSVSFDVLIKEITEEAEFSAYQALADLHYRGKALHGRSSRLVARSFHPMYPSIIGYIELATPFYMSKPRSALLNAPFHSNGIAWERWDTPHCGNISTSWCGSLDVWCTRYSGVSA